MTCKDCVHFKVCEFVGMYFEDVAVEASSSDDVEDLCPRFENKADFVEVKHGAWTPVKEELPRSRREYLCICVFDESERQYYNVLRFHPETNAENGYVTGPHFSNEGMNGMRVTHWMPLPKPPRGAE